MPLSPRRSLLAYFLSLLGFSSFTAIYQSLTLPAPYQHHNDDDEDGVPTMRNSPHVLWKKQQKGSANLVPPHRDSIASPRAVDSNQTEQAHDLSSTFGGCLLIMDDNHMLPEWLAYHYLTLPLRRLIVAVDPRSQSSPTNILDRYRRYNLMNITEWSDADFMPHNHKVIRRRLNRARQKQQQGKRLEDPLVYLHRDRQSYFITKCLQTLKGEGAHWTIHLDTDEYILPNYNAQGPYRINTTMSIPDVERQALLNKDHDHDPAVATTTTTIHEIIQAQQHIDDHLGSACIALPRVRIGTKESSVQQIQAGMPSALMLSQSPQRGYLNASDFQTLRWRWRNRIQYNKNNGQAKAMVDVSRIPPEDLHFDITANNPHRPVERHCLVRHMYMDPHNSSFLVHHYASTWEQWSARQNDARRDPKANGRTRAVYDNLLKLSIRQTDHIRHWLSDFWNVMGTGRTLELLDGVGQLDPAVLATSGGTGGTA